VSPTSEVSAPLATVIAEVERTGWAAQVTDAEWRLRWVSRELKALLGSEDEEELGYGRHVVEAYQREIWSATVTPESQAQQLATDVPKMLAGTPGGKEAIKELLPEEARAWLGGFDSAAVPPLWTSELDFVQGDLPPARVQVLNLRLADESAQPLGVLRLYGSALPASLLALVGRGDQAMFERMARLFEPGRRQGAILFADLQASGALARRMSSAAYFSLIRSLTTAIDEIVIRNKGIVGKHAGDGVTAFFLEADLGSVSAAVRAAVETGRGIAAVSERAGEDTVFNLGLHWGATLYMGQVVTGGRIEVTALGDEVNEGARIQQVARDGEVLASKPLIERLEDQDAEALGLALDHLSYHPVSEIAGASDKAVRDAGAIAVTNVRSRG
jgi:class 3 adenylate cyclase